MCTFFSFYPRILNASRACNECLGTSLVRKSLSAKMESEITLRCHPTMNIIIVAQHVIFVQ